MPGRLEQVSIALDHREVALTSDARLDLLARLTRRPIGSPDQNETLIAAFRRVGPNRPIRLDSAEKTHLLAVLQHWSFDNGLGYSGLPKGMRRLSNALRDDLLDAERVD